MYLTFSKGLVKFSAKSSKMNFAVTAVSFFNIKRMAQYMWLRNELQLISQAYK